MKYAWSLRTSCITNVCVTTLAYCKRVQVGPSATCDDVTNFNELYDVYEQTEQLWLVSWTLNHCGSDHWDNWSSWPVVHLYPVLCKVVARGLIERGAGGAIVNISSQSSVRCQQNHIVYTTSKAAVDQLTRCLAFELGPHKVWCFHFMHKYIHRAFVTWHKWKAQGTQRKTKATYREIRQPEGKCFKFSAALWKCVTCKNVCWQTVPQLSTSSGEGSISNSCTLRLADVQLMDEWWLQTPPGLHVRQLLMLMSMPLWNRHCSGFRINGSI